MELEYEKYQEVKEKGMLFFFRAYLVRLASPFIEGLEAKVIFRDKVDTFLTINHSN